MPSKIKFSLNYYLINFFLVLARTKKNMNIFLFKSYYIILISNLLLFLKINKNQNLFNKYSLKKIAR
jgi:hypothetical protein